MNIKIGKYLIFNCTDAVRDILFHAAGDSVQEISSPYELELTGGEAALLVLPGDDVSISLRANLTEEGAQLLMSGAYICEGSQKVSLKTHVTHAVGGCYSSQLFKGVLSGASKSDFSGRIVVAHGAEKTESYQENHNLLLSPAAKALTCPELEIYADDVKCNHGATVGQLSAEELFYMRSRGISKDEATALQIQSFLASALKAFPEEVLQAVL